QEAEGLQAMQFEAAASAAPYRAYELRQMSRKRRPAQAQRRPAMNIRRDAMVRLKNPSSP
ncbi:hypothetical protein ACVBRP_002140, partial [Klebsiella pneumoniae]